MNTRQSDREQWLEDFWRVLAEENGVDINDIELDSQYSSYDFGEE